jgi:hypothetical protein
VINFSNIGIWSDHPLDMALVKHRDNLTFTMGVSSLHLLWSECQYQNLYKVGLSLVFLSFEFHNLE